MKKLLLILFCLVLTSCHETYNIITDDNLAESRFNMLSIADNYGYQVKLTDTEDTMIRYTENSVVCHNYWTIEHYDFISDVDSFQVDLKYRNRCVTEARTIPYYDMLSIGCNGKTDICDSIQRTIDNTPTTNMRVMTEGSMSCLLVGAAMIPFVILLSYAAIFNTK